MRTHTFLPALVGSLLVGLAAAPRAQLTSYDPFDYGSTGSTVLDGQVGGFSWGGPWLGVKPGFQAMGSWWPLDGAAGDVGPLASHGIETSTSYVSDTPVAWSSNSLMLDGSSFVDLSAHVGKYESLFRGTVSMWVKTSMSGSGKMAMLSFSNAPSVKFKGRHCTFMIMNNNAALEMRGDIYSYNFEMRSSGNVTDGLWHHICYTSHGDGWTRIYVDGVEVGYRNEGFIGYPLGLDTAQVGRATFNGNVQHAFTGQIDDIAIWGDALTAAEVQTLMTQPPVAVLGPRSATGPKLGVQRLATPAFLSGAYSATGLTTVGNRLDIVGGLRAVRMLGTPISYGSTQTFYLSFLVRRDDRGLSTTGGEIELATDQVRGLRVGWNTTGAWIAGMNGGASQSLVVMQDKTTYFCVVKVRTAGTDNVWLKPYAPGDTVHISDSLLSGVGTGANNWAVNRSESRSEPVDHILITPIADSNGNFNTVFSIDELRLGPTWDSVTRHSFATSCGGLQIGRTNRPLLGSNDFTVDLSSAQPTVPAFLIFGQSNRSWVGNTLPLALSSVGALPECFLNVSLDFTVPTSTDAAGNARIPIRIPNDPLLSSLVLFNQWTAADPTLAAQLPAAFSPGQAIQIGH